MILLTLFKLKHTEDPINDLVVDALRKTVWNVCSNVLRSTAHDNAVFQLALNEADTYKDTIRSMGKAGAAFRRQATWIGFERYLCLYIIYDPMPFH